MISQKIACALCRNEADNENQELYSYAIYVVLMSVLHIATVTVIGIALSALMQAVIFYLTFILLRKCAGGYHASNPVNCYIFSVCVTVAAMLILKQAIKQNSFNIYLMIAELVGIALVIILSPLDTKSNILNDKEKKLLKKISIFLVLLESVIAHIFIWINKSEYGLPIIFGICLVALVLCMRKLQMIKESKKDVSADK